MTKLPFPLLVPREDQPRKYMETSGISELALSIRALGILEPLLVRPPPDGRYQIVAGERRYRAAKALGLTEVPVVVDMDEETVEKASLAENLARKGLSASEVILALRRQFPGLSDGEFWELMGKFRTHVRHNTPLDESLKEVYRFTRQVGLSETSLANYIFLFRGLSTQELEILAQAGIGKGEMQKLKKEPGLLEKFFREVERRREVAATFGVPSPVLARENVLRRSKERKRTPRLERAYGHLERAWEILEDAGLKELSQALEELMDRLEAVTSQAAKG